MIHLVSFLIYGLMAPVFHPVYISTSEILFAHDGTWSAEVKIFYDDLEDAIQNVRGVRPNLHPEHITDAQDDIFQYLQTKLNLKLSDQEVPYHLISCLRLEEIIIINIEGDGIWIPGNLWIENKILFELFEKQKNIMTIQHLTDKVFFYLSKKSTSKQLTLPLQ